MVHQKIFTGRFHRDFITSWPSRCSRTLKWVTACRKHFSNSCHRNFCMCREDAPQSAGTRRCSTVSAAANQPHRHDKWLAVAITVGATSCSRTLRCTIQSLTVHFRNRNRNFVTFWENYSSTAGAISSVTFFFFFLSSFFSSICSVAFLRNHTNYASPYAPF